MGRSPRAKANRSDTDRDPPIPPKPPPLPLPLAPSLPNMGCDCNALLAAPSVADCTTDATRCCAAAVAARCHACGGDEADGEAEGR